MALTLPGFLATLNNYSERIPLDKLVQHMQELELSLDEVQHCLRYSPERYTRNLLAAGPAYQALILCWQPQQESAIHDHIGSSCGVYVLTGECSEVFYDRRADGSLTARPLRCNNMSQVSGAQDENMHKICNLSETEPLVTLHIYSPPLLMMNTYNEAGEVTGELHVEVGA